MNQGLFRFIEESPTAFHAVAATGRRLEEAGFRRLEETERWELERGASYYTTRNGSALIAFRIPGGAFSGYLMTAAHGDSPCYKIKENAEYKHDGYVSLSTEGYGDMINASWTDRPLSVAGRVTVRTGKGMEVRLVDLKEPVALVPNVSIHMNRDMNKNSTYNPARDMQPLLCDEKGMGRSLRERIAGILGIPAENILTTDLYIYNPQKGICWGDYISAPRLDDLQCAYACLSGIISAKPESAVAVFCLFDNEEVGSMTKQGADSTFLSDVLERIASGLGMDGQEQAEKLANSFMISADNAHALHPNHGEFRDPNQTVHMNGGIVFKLNANQKYTTDAVSAALMRLVCEKAEVPYQYYANRADMKGGSTIGNISASRVSVNTVDVGLAQLAMHSAFETAGSRDTEYLARAVKLYYGRSIVKNGGSYELN